MSTTYDMVGDNVLIEPANRQEVRPSGLIIPPNAQLDPQEGTVLAVGPGRVTEHGARIEPDCAVGDVVVYNKYGAIEVKRGDDRYIIANSRLILAIIRES